MSTQVQVIESVFDTFKVERTFVAVRDGVEELHAIVSGVECLVDAKPTLLDAGLVFCAPIDSRLAEHWPVYSDLVIDGHQGRWWNITNQPQLVDAARAARAARGDR